MRKCVIEKLDNNGNIVLNTYSNINSKTILSKYVNDAMYSKLNLEQYVVEDIQASKETIVYFKGKDNKNDQFELVFDTSLLYNDYMYPLVQTLNNYLKEKNIEELKRKKVRRENLHKGSKIVALILLISLLASVAAHFKKKSKDNSDIIMFERVVEIPESSTKFTTNLKLDENQTVAPQEKVKKVYIDFSEFKADEEKSLNVELNYASIIEKYAKMYGVNPDVMIAIAKQERGFHSTTMDSGGATGLMQIQNAAWVGEKLSAKNVETGEIESVIVTAEDLGDIEKNIRYSCMIMQNVQDMMKKNELLSIQCYNMGIGNMDKIFAACEAYTGISEEEIINDPMNVDWIAYRNVVTAGDQYYLERILSYICDRRNTNVIKLDSQGEEIVVSSPEKVR